MGKQCKHFILLGSKITVDGDCSHENKRYFLLGRKAMTNLDSILKSRGVNLLTNVHLVKVLVFPVVMYGCESWPKERWALKNWCFFFFFQLMLLSYGIGEDSWEFLGLQGDQTNPEGNWKDWCWSWYSITLTTWWEEWTHWEDPDAGQDLRQEEKGMTGWDGWMASPTR